MTVIAWDGKTLAADKRSTCVGYPSTVTKIYRLQDGLVGFSGDGSHAMALLTWFKDGRDAEKWPASRNSDSHADAIFISNTGEIYEYWGRAGPFSTKYEDQFTASGSGRDYALAAMYLGKSAREAVEVACVLDTGCGNGIDTLEL